MLVTATDIAAWAASKEAQGLLPMLVRRLVFDSGAQPSQLDFPAGDSIGRPGWDGEVKAEASTPWVIKGRSFWELSCEAQPTKKANRDYKKRTTMTPASERASAAFVAISARRWSTKMKWVKEKSASGEWQSVRAFDADDLEQWLEQCAPVALWFSETLGLTGPGVESPGSYWEKWAAQSDPSITPDALFVDRRASVEEWIRQVRSSLAKGTSQPLALSADSVEEATAFACAALLSDDSLAAKCLVVTSEEGWRFIEANTGVRIALAARPEVARRPARRGDIVVVVPYPAADMTDYCGASAGGERHANISLERPRKHEFEKALVSVGLDEAEAGRLATNTGRSWSVLRRQRARNPAIRKPAWLDTEQARSLVTVCLLGTWSGANLGDRETVESLGGSSYNDLERNLRELTQVDDPPVHEIGNVWKAKSPLELFDLFAGRITSSELDRFFLAAREILEAADPALELPAEERFAAALHGKSRAQSSLLIGAICDTLIKLAVRGPLVPSLLNIDIEGRVGDFVRGLLGNADSTRWLSVSPHLQALAEAAPGPFLQTVEESLARPDAPVACLLAETSKAGVMGRCWHAELLWALELLAWSPSYLPRVVVVLTQLCHTELKGNWANKPLASLVGIFRSWLPQTAANLQERIAVLDKLIGLDPAVAFDLLSDLFYAGPDWANPAARPKWRDYGTGVGRGVAEDERRAMVSAAGDRLLQCAKGDPPRVARLLERFDSFEAAHQQILLEMAREVASGQTNDAHKETLRATLRKRIHWQRSYSELPPGTVDEQLQPWEQLYDDLNPSDPVARHRWLFAGGWPRLLSGVSKADHEAYACELATARTDALKEVFAREGMSGVERLAEACPGEAWVGVTLPALGQSIPELAAWVVASGGEFLEGHPLRATIAGLLRGLASGEALSLIHSALDRGTSWGPEQAARFLALANPTPEVWEFAASLGGDVAQAYWSCVPSFWLRPGDVDLAIPIRRLLDAGRPRTAFGMCELDLGDLPAPLIADVLERLLAVDEAAGPRPNEWHIAKAIEHMERSGAVAPDRLLRLEFWLIPLLGFLGERNAHVLYDALTSQPKLFVELLGTLYKPEHGELAEEASQATRAAGEIAWHVFRACTRLPGTQPDGAINADELVRFVDQGRELARGLDRLTVFDLTLGEILCHAPIGADGAWPCEPVRDLLERTELGKVREGFSIGTRTKHGSTCRAYDEGGSQERKLAADFQRSVAALQGSHPNVASLLSELAHGYEREGLREDLEAKLRIEGH